MTNRQFLTLLGISLAICLFFAIKLIDIMLR